MPLIAHSSLPTFDRLAGDGVEVLNPERAQHQDIRELHVGLLNMMPDAALEATERQFMRLLAGSNRIVQIYVHVFTVPGIERGAGAQKHIDRHYRDFADIQRAGLDALIVTGANITQPDLDQEAFYPPLCDIAAWAQSHVASVLCSCLASHALWLNDHGLRRRHLGEKRWGVFDHRVVARDHPLVTNINTRFSAPHSRFNDVSAHLLAAHGVHTLVESSMGEVLLAVSDDGFSQVYMQGHPEYDAQSLAKEYKREVGRFFRKERDDYPPYPENYLSDTAESLLANYRGEVHAALERSESLPEFPEDELMPHIDNTWADTGKAIFNNWLGLVYRLTNLNRHERFMNGVDPNAPLGWRAAT